MSRRDPGSGGPAPSWHQSEQASGEVGMSFCPCRAEDGLERTVGGRAAVVSKSAVARLRSITSLINVGPGRLTQRAARNGVAFDSRSPREMAVLESVSELALSTLPMAVYVRYNIDGKHRSALHQRLQEESLGVLGANQHGFPGPFGVSRSYRL